MSRIIFSPPGGPPAASALMRPPGEVMRPARLGAFHQTRLSTARTLVRRMAREAWRFFPAAWQAAEGARSGTVLYRIDTPAGPWCFVAACDPRTLPVGADRAKGWGVAFALGRGTADETLRALRRAVRGRTGARRAGAGSLILLRAEPSARLFDRVIAGLAAGRQPCLAELVEVGCLMRVTIGGDGDAPSAPGLAGGRTLPSLPGQAVLLAAYLARQASFVLVDELARRRNPSAAALDARSRRALGIGSAFGPSDGAAIGACLLDGRIGARETALARVRAVDATDVVHCSRFAALLARAYGHAGQWTAADPPQRQRIARLRAELYGLQQDLADPVFLAAPRPWDFLYRRAVQRLGIEAQEMLASLLIELYPELVDDLEDAGAIGDLAIGDLARADAGSRRPAAGYGVLPAGTGDPACRPGDLLRCYLAICGASKFDRPSDRRMRGILFQGAPPIDELDDPDADDWLFPSFALTPPRLPRAAACRRGI